LRPTRTPIEQQARTRKPTKTLRPTRTPIEVGERTRKPTKTLRPTRTPISQQARTRKPTKTSRPTRTPVSAEDRTRKPTKTLRPTRTPIPPEAGDEFDPSGITARCTFRYKGGPASKPDLVRVFLTVRNNSGAPITDFVPAALDISGSGSVAMDTSASSRRSMPNGSVYTSQWSFDLDGVVNVSASATANDPDGNTITIGPVDCGSINGDAS
jgi:hypothetical protein